MFEQSREDICKWREELNKKCKRKISSKNTEEIMNENKQVTITEVLEDENLEQQNLLIDDSRTEIEEIPNDENIEHSNQEIESNGEKKNQITKKTKEKKTKIRGMIRPKKVRLTREILEMTRRDVYKRQILLLLIK